MALPVTLIDYCLSRRQNHLAQFKSWILPDWLQSARLTGISPPDVQTQIPSAPSAHHHPQLEATKARQPGTDSATKTVSPLPSCTVGLPSPTRPPQWLCVLFWEWSNKLALPILIKCSGCIGQHLPLLWAQVQFKQGIWKESRKIILEPLHSGQWEGEKQIHGGKSSPSEQIEKNGTTSLDLSKWSYKHEILWSWKKGLHILADTPPAQTPTKGFCHPFTHYC